MKIAIHCVDCGKLLGEIDTAENKKLSRFDAPCGERVCPSCCRTCRKESVERGEPCRKQEQPQKVCVAASDKPAREESIGKRSAGYAKDGRYAV